MADITYLPTVAGCAYRSPLTDAWSRRIVGWHMHASLQTEEVAQARQMVRESVQIYNEERPHTSLKMQTPGTVHWASTKSGLSSAA